MPDLYAAILFDCDGTLVDSEPVHALGLTACLRRFGVNIATEDLYRRFMGLDNEAVGRALRRDGFELPEDFAALTEQITFDLAGTHVKEMAHARVVLTALAAQGTQLAVGTNSTPVLATAMLESAGLLEFFGDRIVTRKDVKAPKPAPDIYLRAMELTGYPAESCLVVEDSVPGVLAARAAGIAATGYCPAGPEMQVRNLREAGADRVIADLRELL